VSACIAGGVVRISNHLVGAFVIGLILLWTIGVLFSDIAIDQRFGRFTVPHQRSFYWLAVQV